MLGYQLLHFGWGCNLQTIDNRMLQTGIIVNEYHDPILVTLMQPVEQLATGLTRAIDDDFFRAGAQFCLIIGAHDQA